MIMIELNFKSFFWQEVFFIFVRSFPPFSRYLSFKEKHTFRHLHPCHVNNFSYCSACSHFANQRMLRLLFFLPFSFFFYYYAFSVKIIQRIITRIFNFPSLININVISILFLEEQIDLSNKVNIKQSTFSKKVSSLIIIILIIIIIIELPLLLLFYHIIILYHIKNGYIIKI